MLFYCSDTFLRGSRQVAKIPVMDFKEGYGSWLLKNSRNHPIKTRESVVIQSYPPTDLEKATTTDTANTRIPPPKLKRGRPDPRDVSPPRRSRALNRSIPSPLVPEAFTDDASAFARGKTPRGRLWDPEDDLPSQRPPPQRPRARNPHLDPPGSYGSHIDFGLIKQPETRPISQEQLVAEVKGIYAGLVMVESKAIEVDNSKNAASTTQHTHRIGIKGYRNQGSFSSGGKDYSVQGVVGDTPVSGAVDTGAERSCVSTEFAAIYGLSPQDGTQHTVKLGNGKTVQSPGIVSVPWRFADEPQTHSLECAIIPGCVHDLILGAKFLRLTETLTTFYKKRVKQTLRFLRNAHDLAGKLRLGLLGAEKRRMWGYLNQKLASALPDSGSDVMLISAGYARSRGLHIDRARRHHLELQLGDGSYTTTCGLVKGLQWSFGDSGEAVTSDFYILEDLPVDIVLSNEFLFELDVFSRFGEYLVQLDSDFDIAELYPIKLIGIYSDELLELENQYINDCW